MKFSNLVLATMMIFTFSFANMAEAKKHSGKKASVSKSVKHKKKIAKKDKKKKLAKADKKKHRDVASEKKSKKKKSKGKKKKH